MYEKRIDKERGIEEMNKEEPGKVESVGHLTDVNGDNVKNNSKYKIIIGIVTLGIIGLIIGCIALIIDLICPYDIGDYKEVAEVCDEVLELELIREDTEDMNEAYAHLECHTVDCAVGIKNSSSEYVEVSWVEFSKTKEAKRYYSYIADESISEMKTVGSNYSYSKSSRKTELSFVYDGLFSKNIIINTGKNVVIIFVSGEKENVADIAEEFIDELD